MKKEIYNKIDKSINDIHDILFYLKYLSSDEDYQKIIKLMEDIREVRCELQGSINPVLISLKEYTEGHISWERAGTLSDLHIFGLRDYCSNHGVDWRNLRCDAYYGPFDAQIVKDEWLKLNPSKEYYPKDFTGNNILFKSDNEINYKKVLENFYTKKGMYMISEVILNVRECFNYLLNNEDIVEDDLKGFDYDLKFLKEASDILWIYNEGDLIKLYTITNKSNMLLNRCKEVGDLNLINDAINLLKDNINRGCYFCTIKKNR